MNAADAAVAKREADGRVRPGVAHGSCRLAVAMCEAPTLATTAEAT